MSIDVQGTAVYLERRKYPNGREGLVAMYSDPDPETGHHECYDILTINLPDEHLEPGDILVRGWNEHKPLRDAAYATGLFFDTGRRIKTGFCEAEVWRYREDRG